MIQQTVMFRTNPQGELSIEHFENNREATIKEQIFSTQCNAILKASMVTMTAHLNDIKQPWKIEDLNYILNGLLVRADEIRELRLRDPDAPTPEL